MKARTYFESLGRRDQATGRKCRQNMNWPYWAAARYHFGFIWNAPFKSLARKNQVKHEHAHP